VRYAANLAVVAARERFPGRMITEVDGDSWVVRIDSAPPPLHLTHQSNLDALNLDDRVSTGRINPTSRSDPDPLLETCGRLADAVYDWWGGSPPPLLYRSRTVPSTGRSIAFSEWASVRAGVVGRLRDAASLQTELVLRAGFTVPPAWLA
jgi:hypothetical protein